MIPAVTSSAIMNRRGDRMSRLVGLLNIHSGESLPFGIFVSLGRLVPRVHGKLTGSIVYLSHENAFSVRVVMAEVRAHL